MDFTAKSRIDECKFHANDSSSYDSKRFGDICKFNNSSLVRISGKSAGIRGFCALDGCNNKLSKSCFPFGAFHSKMPFFSITALPFITSILCFHKFDSLYQGIYNFVLFIPYLFQEYSQEGMETHIFSIFRFEIKFVTETNVFVNTSSVQACPPNLSYSIKTVLSPCCAHLIAATYPPGLPPIIATSRQ